jgi:hypothetical protein
MKLKERAEHLFGGVSDSALVSVLQNVSRAKFRRATTALVTAISVVSKAKKASEPTPPRNVAPAPVRELQQNAVA